MDRRIDGAAYRIVFARERQVLNGREFLVLVDPDRREIRLGGSIRELLVEGIAAARGIERWRPAPSPSPARALTHGDSAPRRIGPTGRASVPVTVSGCFNCHVIPWPWWED